MKEFHEVANIFPLMTEAEFSSLKADIAENGLREAVWLHPDGSIIDGRNRYNACTELGIVPEFRTWNGDGSLVSFVVSLNLHRRHLNSGQLAMVALDILPLLEEEAKERQGVRNDKPTTSVNSLTEVVAQPKRATAQAAAITGTNRQYVSDAKRIAAESPNLAAQVRAGTVTMTQAKRTMKETKREERRQENRGKAGETTSLISTVAGARFATILLDPPWDWGDEGDVNQLGRAKPDYATMAINDLAALPVPALSDVDCHIYMWITNRSLPKGFSILEAWGFRYITCLTWVKPSFGMGNYFRGQTEHILFGVKGSQPLKRKDMGTVFHAGRGQNGHSSKPTEVYEIIESCSPGPYLEMFAREQREGWSVWGADSNGS